MTALILTNHSLQDILPIISSAKVTNRLSQEYSPVSIPRGSKGISNLLKNSVDVPLFTKENFEKVVLLKSVNEEMILQLSWYIGIAKFSSLD